MGWHRAVNPAIEISDTVRFRGPEPKMDHRPTGVGMQLLTADC